MAGGTSGALQYGFNDSVTNAFGTPPKAAMVFEGDFVSGVILSSTKSKANSGFNVAPFPSITAGPDAGAVEISGDLFSHEFTIQRDGRTAATISKRWLSLTASYAVDVAPGENDLLILATVIALDLALDRRDHAA